MGIASQMPTPALSTSTSRPAYFCGSSHSSILKASKSAVPSCHLPSPPVSFSTWSGLKNLGALQSPRPLRFDRRKRCRGMVVYASLFGVGAPEALVIGVVALLVFGPKGLAEVARNLGKTLRAFQPTIRELQEVSREFKSTLEKEIGLDESSEQNLYSASKSSPIQSTSQNLNSANDVSPSQSPPVAISEQAPQPDANGSSGPAKAYSSEELLKVTEEQLSAATTVKQQQTSFPQGKIETSASPPSETE
ncbi:hypothetical protein MLD38_033535 [Melastoma candidum]|uniref:Uncharacterized protein n=1 Tax=Melastoma candidum TaxID=119954 RepID=A0ACB9M730_9MYRT|nr:hypothetical protein MLD38_033535 [Melastoma candidum]